MKKVHLGPIRASKFQNRLLSIYMHVSGGGQGTMAPKTAADKSKKADTAKLTQLQVADWIEKVIMVDATQVAGVLSGVRRNSSRMVRWTLGMGQSVHDHRFRGSRGTGFSGTQLIGRDLHPLLTRCVFTQTTATCGQGSGAGQAADARASTHGGRQLG
jgi:hypothetical protein